jgi:uncharacterized surface protein with fasciclin (FAS1) repeats
VLHFVDNVILPQLNVVDTAIMRGHTLYAEAVRRAGLEALLHGPGPFTVFAFTDDVFSGNPALLSDPDLADVLRYHIADEAFPVLEHGLLFRSLEGTNRTIAYDPVEGVYRLDGLAEIAGPLTSTNGVFYVVDAASSPPALRGSR